MLTYGEAAAAEEAACPSTTDAVIEDVSGDIIISYSIIELCLLVGDEAVVRIMLAAIEPFYIQIAADSWSSDGSRAEAMIHYLHLACAHDVSYVFEWFESLCNISSSSSSSSTSEENSSSDRTVWKRALEVHHKVSLQQLPSIFKKKKQQLMVYPMSMLQLALLCGSGGVIKYLLRSGDRCVRIHGGRHEGSDL